MAIHRIKMDEMLTWLYAGAGRKEKWALKNN